MPLVSVLRIKNRWNTVFAQAGWSKVVSVYETMNTAISGINKDAAAVVDLGEVVMARFDDEAVAEKALPKGLPQGSAIGAFKKDAPIDLEFAKKCLNMAPFISGGTADLSESDDDELPSASVLALIEVPDMDADQALSALIDPDSALKSVKDLNAWLENAMQAPDINGFAIADGRVAIQGPVDKALRLAITAAMEMKLRVSIAVGSKGTHPGMMWTAVGGLNDMQKQAFEGASFDWTIIRGIWDPKDALSRQNTGTALKPGTTMRPYPVPGDDVGSLAWFLALSEDLRSNRAREAMSAGARHGSAMTRQANESYNIRLERYDIGADGYILRDNVKVTPVFDLAEFMEIMASGGVG